MASSSQPVTLVGEIQAQVITPLAASLASSSPLLAEGTAGQSQAQALASRTLDILVSALALLALAPLLLLVALLIRLDSSGPVLFRQTYRWYQRHSVFAICPLLS